ncbi:MAG: hypothetical protein PF483_09090 [Halothiobacillus sp.]|nr:hypothetical protein [Halothiobacillus sp.]
MKLMYWLSLALLLTGLILFNVNIMAGYAVLFLGAILRRSLHENLNVSMGMRGVFWYHYVTATYLVLISIAFLYLALSGTWQHNGIPSAPELIFWLTPMFLVVMYDEYKFYNKWFSNGGAQP